VRKGRKKNEVHPTFVSSKVELEVLHHDHIDSKGMSTALYTGNGLRMASSVDKEGVLLL